MEKKRIIILGGGFGGVYTAMHLEKLFRKNEEYEIVLVNRENYFVYQPMLAEVVGGTVGVYDTVSGLRRLLSHTTLYMRDIEAVDIEKKTVTLSPQFTHKHLVLSYEHLVISLGNVTDFRGVAGLHEHAMPFKNLSDALRIRNHLIDVIEEAAITEDPKLRKMLLTFVVGGGGFSGTEVVAEINDFSQRLGKQYKNIKREEIQVILVHSKDRLMDKELPESLSRYAGKILEKKGVDIRFGRRLSSATPQAAILDDGTKIPSKTIISTVPSSPNPVVEAIPVSQERGKIKTDAKLQVENQSNIWALGDCAMIPQIDSGGFCPPTAQFAIREAKVLAKNIHAAVTGGQKTDFRFKSLGMLGALGHHNAVAELFGCIKLSGIIAWIMWRAIYWTKLPGFDRKLKVLFSWLLDMIIPIESVQLKLSPSQGISQLHFESGEVIFHEGDIGDFLYIIVNGKVEVYHESNGKETPITKLGKGEFFGEMSLLNEKQRTATVRCTEPCDLLAIRKSDFGVLLANFTQLREQVKTTEERRRAENE